MTHKIIIEPKIIELDASFVYENKGNVVLYCSCGHQIELRLSINKDWPKLLATCDVIFEEEL